MGNDTSYQQVITIDGPSGTGKSTIAKLIVDQNSDKFWYVNSGILYRKIALMLENDILSISDLLYNEKLIILIKGYSNEKELYNQKIDKLASKYSKILKIRELVTEIIRNDYKKHLMLFPNKFLIIDGRDAGTNIFKNAFLKIYMDLNYKKRVKRRSLDEGYSNLDEELFFNEMKKRDENDKNRKNNPLYKSNDTIEVLNDGTKQETVNKIISIFLKKLSADKIINK